MCKVYLSRGRRRESCKVSSEYRRLTSSGNIVSSLLAFNGVVRHRGWHYKQLLTANIVQQGFNQILRDLKLEAIHYNLQHSFQLKYTVNY